MVSKMLDQVLNTINLMSNKGAAVAFPPLPNK